MQGKRCAGWTFCDENHFQDETLAGWKIEVYKKFAKRKIMVREIYGVISSWSGKFAGRKNRDAKKIAGWNFVLRKIPRLRYQWWEDFVG